jgi:hypothetical protein
LTSFDFERSHQKLFFVAKFRGHRGPRGNDDGLQAVRERVDPAVSQRYHMDHNVAELETLGCQMNENFAVPLMRRKQSFATGFRIGIRPANVFAYVCKLLVVVKLSNEVRH